jgi:predicted secreted hydrolase
MRYRFFVLSLLLLCAILGFSNSNRYEKPLIISSNSGLLAPVGNFKKADRVIPFSFPLDHGAHPDYQTEWWYYTGNLKTADGRTFGYQLTFFRRSISDNTAARKSAWASNQVYMAHFALTDPEVKKYSFFETLERGIPGLAGAEGQPVFTVWLHDWEVKQTGNDTYHLKASQDSIAIEFDLVDGKGPILQGDRGYSRKGSEPGNASYYYSQTRLKTSGLIRVDDKEYQVTGLSWMDHEFSTSALGRGVIGWDWFSIQLDDETELMLFQLRKEDGSLDEYSSGTIIGRDGSTRSLAVAEFSIKPVETWQSPTTKARYPSGWQISIPSEDVQFTVSPTLKDQEATGFFTYWEGSSIINGIKKGNPVSGSGYVELTGYAASMQGQF